MSINHFAKLPEALRETASAALTASFGALAVDNISPVLGGVSGAAVYRVDAGGRRYVLRMEGPHGPLRYPHQYQSMRLAAEAGLAPRVHYIDESAGVVVMDFIAAQSLDTYPGGDRGLAQAAGEMLRQVHALPTFPRFVDYRDIVARLWDHVCRMGLFADGLLDAHSGRLSQILEAYVWNANDSVASHNDFLPRNLLFDGQRLWLIDWEAAYCNDPLVDVAAALDNFAPSPELKELLLRTWLGRAPDQALRDRLVLTSALTRLYYAGALFCASARGERDAPETDLSALTAGEFEQAVRSGRLKPETPETSHALGKMYLASFLTGLAPPGLPPRFMG